MTRSEPPAEVVEGLIDALNAAAGCNDLSGISNDLLFSYACNQLQSVEIICRDAIEAYEKSTGGDPRGEATPSPSSARERREIIEECAKLVESRLYDYRAHGSIDFPDNMPVELGHAIRSLSSDGRGREKGNTSNASEGVDPTPPATESTKS